LRPAAPAIVPISCAQLFFNYFFKVNRTDQTTLQAMMSSVDVWVCNSFLTLSAKGEERKTGPSFRTMTPKSLLNLAGNLRDCAPDVPSEIVGKVTYRFPAVR
jgi:hypothetical protein